uniref:Uncharacterized protein n=1 Tax=Arundo donax TaxID=35708 RepID=A0A0A9BSQ3_ARUDO
MDGAQMWWCACQLDWKIRTGPLD